MYIYFHIDYHLSAPYTMEEAVTVIQCDNCDSFLQKIMWYTDQKQLRAVKKALSSKVESLIWLARTRTDIKL